MRKYLLNFSVISAVAGSFSLVQATRKGPRDWRLALLWAGWLVAVALAVGTVAEEAKAQRLEQ